MFISSPPRRFGGSPLPHLCPACSPFLISRALSGAPAAAQPSSASAGALNIRRLRAEQRTERNTDRQGTISNCEGESRHRAAPQDGRCGLHRARLAHVQGRSDADAAVAGCALILHHEEDDAAVGRPSLRKICVTKHFDVLGLGCTAVDDILYVPAYPPADGKVEVRLRERHCGGLTATALVAAARLGASCAFAGTLGRDAESKFVLGVLNREGIDTRHVVTRENAGPIRSVIVVDETRRTRNIFYDASNALGADPRLPSKAVILSSRVLIVDRFGIPGMIRAARIARAACIPVVADFESRHLPRFAELLELSDHLIVSETFAGALTRARTPSAAAIKLFNRGRSVVVVTCGAKGCWFLDREMKRPGHLPAFRVPAIDTTGCGDVFHGAYAAALARGAELTVRLRFASAAAAIKATKHGGQAGVPTRAAVNAFLRERP